MLRVLQVLSFFSISIFFDTKYYKIHHIVFHSSLEYTFKKGGILWQKTNLAIKTVQQFVFL